MTEQHLRYVFDLLGGQDDANYIGESITQLAHSLQAAHLAVEAQTSEEVAIAALLHDIGQFLPLTEKEQARGNIVDDSGRSVGRHGHDVIGEQWLRAQGWPDRVCQLVGAHVMAKRYLAMEIEYFESLSMASRSSLKGQGGPFTEKEARHLEQTDAMLADKLALRRFDDGAKVVGKRTRDLEQWLEVANRVYNRKGLERVQPLPVELVN